jgi:protein-tyrosine phosphatase
VDRDLDWPGCANVRDLGGLETADGATTAFGIVVRADNVRSLTPAGWEAARAYGIRTVLDLRSDAECADDAPVDAAFHVVRISLFDDFDGDAAYRADLVRRVGDREAAEQYRTLYLEALERNANRFGEALGALAAAAPGGAIVHCIGGKDRTGVLAALLLRLVGVPVDVVADDYARSNARLGTPDGAPAGVIDHVLEAIESSHGSVERYFADAGAAPADLERVAARLRPRPER